MKNKVTLKNHSNRKLMIFGVLICAIVGSLLIIVSFADTTGNTTNNASYSSSALCGERVSNYSYQVPWGNAIWNQPICGKAKHPKSTDYVNRFIEWGHVNDGSASADVNNGKISNDPGFPNYSLLDPLAGLFTREVYYASDATTTAKIIASVYYSNLDGVDLPYQDSRLSLPNTPIPWNPNWETGKGGDNEIVILDDRPGVTQGRIYEISGYKKGLEATGQCALLLLADPNRLCTYTVNIGRDLEGKIIDYRTYEGFTDGRGAGLSMYATLTTPEEVAAGEIRHALGISLPNTSFGPICSDLQKGTSVEGYSCGTALIPATKFEWGSVTASTMMSEPYKSIYTLEKTIPEGMLFALDITDTQIESWINSRADLKANSRRAETARIFARALRDYGMMVVDTNGARPVIQLSGGVNPKAATMWTNLGMGPTEKDNMLDGLITKSNLYVVDPPTALCVDGTTSKYYCDWKTVEYPNSTSPGSSKLGDINNDNKVDVLDLSRLLSLWDPYATKPKSNADINNDNKVDVIDMSILLTNWGK